MTRRNRKKKPVTVYNGDHGTGTAAALAGTAIAPLTDDHGKKDPNNRARRYRIEVIDTLKTLTMRQTQAAKEIRDAYCRAEMCSSGAPLKEQVDASPRPDAAIAAQVGAMSRLAFVMSAVPQHQRYVVEAICWHNTPIRHVMADAKRSHSVVMSDLKGAMTCVANKMRY